MPTYEGTERFKEQFSRLTPGQRTAFLATVETFVHDLRRGQFRKGLRVEKLARTGEWELTWAPDGRAVFEYGPSKRPDDFHIIWLRIGGHDILDQP